MSAFEIKTAINNIYGLCFLFWVDRYSIPLISEIINEIKKNNLL